MAEFVVVMRMSCVVFLCAGQPVAGKIESGMGVISCNVFTLLIGMRHCRLPPMASSTRSLITGVTGVINDNGTKVRQSTSIVYVL